ncbi:MAG TPA: Na(+)/H(+) antiporter subunit D [Candidatus Tectomicrobia bacterium]|nr:Na(+)/H(+) antiporter subunit D [Candidatus Tectomicrobia bacterium]
MRELHPAIPFLVGAVLVAVLPARPRRVAALLTPAIGIALACALRDGARTGVPLLGTAIVVLDVDALGRVFAIVFALLGGLGAVYGLHAAGRRLYAAAFVATAAALGVVLAGDWVTFYAAWELLAIASFVLVIDGGHARASRSALRYLLVHATGGAVLLGGITWHVAAGGALAIRDPLAGVPALAILVAFAINAALPPLHAWLTDAYPESSPAGTVFLSAFATKAAVYALARVFPGTEALVWWGAAMALYGVVFAVLENDIRRLLGYHIVSQVGYMVAGVGLGTPLALSGVAAHAFCHVLYKGLLMMGAGAVVHATGRRRLTELGGLARAMPATLALYMVGAFSISGAPLLNGFVSKSLVVAAAESEHRVVVSTLLTLASVGTFLHTGLKLPYFTFASAPSAPPERPVPRSMIVAMALAAAACLVLGVAPDALYALLPFPVTYEPYTAAHVIASLQLLAGTALGFAWFRAALGGERTVTLDADRLYAAIGRALTALARAIGRASDGLEDLATRSVDLSMPARRAIPRPLGYAVMVVLGAVGVVSVMFAFR